MKKSALPIFFAISILLIAQATYAQETTKPPATKPPLAKPVVVTPVAAEIKPAAPAKKNTVAPVVSNPVVLTNVGPGLKWDNTTRILHVEKGYTIKRNPDSTITIFNPSAPHTMDAINGQNETKIWCGCMVDLDEDGYRTSGAGNCDPPTIDENNTISCAGNCDGYCKVWKNVPTTPAPGQDAHKKWIDVSTIKSIDVQ